MSSDYATPPPQAGATSEEATPFMQRTFPVGSFFGIPVKLHALFPAYVAVTTVLAFVTALSFERGVLTFLVSGPVLFGTVLVHGSGTASRRGARAGRSGRSSCGPSAGSRTSATTATPSPISKSRSRARSRTSP